MWNFKTTDLGKVSRAEISMAPLVLLVGKNNTGKSYIAMLLWALSNSHVLFQGGDSRERLPAWCKDLIAKKGGKEVAEVHVTEPLANELVDHFNDELGQNGRELLRDVFAYDGFERTSVRVEADRPFVPFTVRLRRWTIDTVDKEPFFRIAIRDGNAARTGTRLFRESDDHFLIAELVYRALFGPNSRRPILYIPAARTGLMLSLGAMITQSFVEDSSPTAGLPRPLRDFIRRLTLRPPRPSPRPHGRGLTAEWLQDRIVHGKIERNVGDVPSFTYVPENTSMSVPLHAASSMITELAPFLVLLKQDSPVRQIIFEEPEAHLHISAQRSMARALARLLNLGVNVLVTSHSDTFVQQINNLMHLYNHPQKAELMKALGYDEDDLIDPDKANAYEFSERGDKTDVTEVRKATGGFIVPSLNDTLINLANETITLQDSEE